MASPVALAGTTAFETVQSFPDPRKKARCRLPAVSVYLPWAAQMPAAEHATCTTVDRGCDAAPDGNGGITSLQSPFASVSRKPLALPDLSVYDPASVQACALMHAPDENDELLSGSLDGIATETGE